MGQQSEVKEEDALFMPCFFAVRSMHHYKTTVTQSLQRRAEVESMKGDFAETTRFLTDDQGVVIRAYGELRQLVADVGGAS